MHLLCSSKKGISAHQLHRVLEVQYKTAWFLSHRIREATCGTALLRLWAASGVSECRIIKKLAKRDDPAQSLRFIEAARELGTDNDPERFKETVRKMAEAPPAKQAPHPYVAQSQERQIVFDPKAEEYRRRAEECRLQADRSKGDEDKARWLKIAAQWQVLAESVHNEPSRNPQPKT